MTRDTQDRRAPLLRHFSEEMPNIEVDEISAALEQLKNGRALGDNGVTSELLNAAGRPALKAPFWRQKGSGLCPAMDCNRLK